MTEANAQLVSELVEIGIARHEAKWLVEEYAVGDIDARAVVLAAAQRRLNGEPLQYILGHWPFRSLDLDVDARVLIPRPETEELVGRALDELARQDVKAPRIMDLGTGSGAIGLSLAFELAERGIHASVICVDESTDALTVAKRNALKHRLLSVSFVHSSWYDGLDTSLEGQFDLIVANPPYVGEDEFVTLDPILLHEPKTAIVAEEAEGTEGFSDLAVIISNAPRWLTPSGALLCEHANIHRNAVIAAATAAGFADAQDFDDLAGKPRMLVARR